MLSVTIISDLPITRWWGRVCIAWRDQTSAAKELWGGILTAIWPSDHTYLVKTVTDRIWATYSTTVSIGKVFGCTYSTTPSKGKVPLPPSPPSLNLLCPFGLSRRYFISDESSFEISCGWQERIIVRNSRTRNSFFSFCWGKGKFVFKFNTDANGQNLKKNNDNGFVIYYVRFILRLDSPSWISSRYEMVF